MDEKFTKQTTRTMLASLPMGGFAEQTEEALSSVEVGEDAKGVRYVKSAKAYASDPLEATKLSVRAFELARAYLDGTPPRAPKEGPGE